MSAQRRSDGEGGGQGSGQGGDHVDRGGDRGRGRARPHAGRQDRLLQLYLQHSFLTTRKLLFVDLCLPSQKSEILT